MVLLDEAAMVGTRALLAPGSGQLTCCPSLAKKSASTVQATAA